MLVFIDSWKSFPANLSWASGVTRMCLDLQFYRQPSMQSGPAWSTLGRKTLANVRGSFNSPSSRQHRPSQAAECWLHTAGLLQVIQDYSSFAMGYSRLFRISLSFHQGYSRLVRITYALLTYSSYNQLYIIIQIGGRLFRITTSFNLSFMLLRFI